MSYETTNHEKIIDYMKKKELSTIYSGWLQKSFEKGNFEPLPFFYEEASYAVQIKNLLFSTMTEEQKIIFKEAIVLALKESYSKNSFILKDLVILAAYIGVYSAADVLIEILMNQSKIDFFKDDYEEVIEKVISVLSGFSKNNIAVSEKTKEAFELLFLGEDFHPRYAAQLFIGLCICCPENYQEYLYEFLRLYRMGLDACAMNLNDKYTSKDYNYNLKLTMIILVNNIHSKVSKEQFGKLNTIMNTFSEVVVPNLTKREEEKSDDVFNAIRVISDAMPEDQKKDNNLRYYIKILSRDKNKDINEKDMDLAETENKNKDINEKDMDLAETENKNIDIKAFNYYAPTIRETFRKVKQDPDANRKLNHSYVSS